MKKGILIGLFLIIGCSRVVIDGPKTGDVYLTSSSENYQLLTDYHVRYAFSLIPTVAYEGLFQSVEVLSSDLNHTYKILEKHQVKKCYFKVSYSLHDYAVSLVASLIPVVNSLSVLYNGARTVEVYGSK